MKKSDKMHRLLVCFLTLCILLSPSHAFFSYAEKDGQELENELFAKEEELTALEKELEDLKQKAAHLHDTEANAAAEIQRYKEQFNQLDSIMAGYADEIAFWEAHLGENSAIIAKMKAYGVSSVGELLSSIEKLKTNIRQDLKALDVVIKKVVDQGTQAREAVLRKQNKIV